MKLQQTIAKVEELKALAEMYEQARQAEAKAQAYAALLQGEAETVDPEQQADIATSLGQMGQRVAVLSDLLLGRTGTASVDDALVRLEELIIRIEQLHEARRQQLQLRATLDVEMALQQVSAEQRQQAEEALGAMQQRIEMCVTRINTLLPSANLIVLG